VHIALLFGMVTVNGIILIRGRRATSAERGRWFELRHILEEVVALNRAAMLPPR
jgi:hypothetical protein